MLVSDKKKWQPRIDKCVKHYTEMESYDPESFMLREIRWQYRDMAAGGDGGELGFTEKGHSTCRAVNYPGHPDWFFARVIELMGWRND